MSRTVHKKEFPAELARAGEARHFVSWTGAVAGLRGGSLSDLAVAAEAVLTDIFLSGESGTLEVESETTGDAVKITIHHPKLYRRRMADLEGIMEQFLDGHELSPTRAVLVKNLGCRGGVQDASARAKTTKTMAPGEAGDEEDAGGRS